MLFCALNNIIQFFKKHQYFILIFLIMLFSFIFRLEALIIRESWTDEAALGANFIENDGFLWAFKPLEHFQMAPPLFLAATKFLNIIFDGAEISYRIIPFLASFASIIVFYILSTRFLSRKRAIIFANFLYGINFALIRFGSEFKQYSSDVLIFMLVLLWLNNFDEQKLQNLKEGVKSALIFSVLFFISQPSVFLLFGFILYNLILNFKDYKKCFYICLIPVLPLIFVFLYKFIMPHHLSDFMYDWWKDGFIEYGNILSLTKENLEFFFYNIKCLMFLFPLIFIGFFISLFKIFKNSKIDKIFMLSFFGVILAGVFKFYPYCHRLILFLFPFFIIFAARVFDFRVSNKNDKILSTFILGFCVLFLFLYSTGLVCKNRYSEIIGLSRARTVSLILKENFSDDDILVLFDYNKNFYTFYKDCLKFRIDEKNIIKIKDYKQENFNNIIAKGKCYWVYAPSYPKNADNFIQWMTKNGGKILYGIKFGEVSHIFKIKF